MKKNKVTEKDQFINMDLLDKEIDPTTPPPPAPICDDEETCVNCGS